MASSHDNKFRYSVLRCIAERGHLIVLAESRFFLLTSLANIDLIVLCGPCTARSPPHCVNSETPMAIYEVTSNQLRKIQETSFSQAGLYERTDLQRLLR